MNKFRKELTEMLDQATQMTDERLARVPEYSVYKIIKAQLEVIRTELDNNIVPTLEMKRRINFDAIAARNLSGDDPEFMAILAQTSFLYRRL